MSKRDYSDPELDALLAEAEPAADPGDKPGQEGEGNADQAPPGATLEEAEEVAALAITGVEKLVSKPWPVLSDVINETVKDKFVQRAAPVMVKRFPDLINNLPLELKKLWFEFGDEIKLGLFCGSLIAACFKAVITEKRRERERPESKPGQDVANAA